MTMKKKRHDRILEIIKENEIDTQGELAQMLRDSGFNVTQATVSRDIRELGLVKVAVAGTGGTRQKYQAAKPVNTEQNRYIRVLRDSVTSLDQAQNLLVIKTGSGMAMAAAAALDSLDWRELIGCIAGDDTIMCVLRTREDGESFLARVNELLR